MALDNSADYEALRLAFMQRGMSDEQPLRQITGGQEYAKT